MLLICLALLVNRGLCPLSMSIVRCCGSSVIYSYVRQLAIDATNGRCLNVINYCTIIFVVNCSTLMPYTPLIFTGIDNVVLLAMPW